MKFIHKILIAVVVVILILAGFFYIIYLNDHYYDRDCLKDIAIDYCKNQNMTFKEGYSNKVGFTPSYFICEGEIEDLRKSNYLPWERFLFLEEELNKCVFQKQEVSK